MNPSEKIIVAVDVNSLPKAEKLISPLRGQVDLFKVGLELITSEGAPAVMKLMDGLAVHTFFDGKFKDIPNTVANAVWAVINMGVSMFNVHCLGGPDMMKAAATMARAHSDCLSRDPPKVLGVTILTSLDLSDLARMGLWSNVFAENISDPDRLTRAKQGELKRIVVTLATLAKECALDGVIASPQEITAIRQACGPDFLIITPGVRPQWAATQDQKRITTPREAILAGADYLVIGRPITNPPPEIGSPLEAAKRIAEEIHQALEYKAKGVTV